MVQQSTVEIDLEAALAVTKGLEEHCLRDSRPEPNYPDLTSIKVNTDPLTYSKRGVNDSPNGYPRLARFITASEEHYVFRQFRYLQSRVLLHLQDDLRSLETRLWRMDAHDEEYRPELLKSRESDDKYFGDRGKIIAQIHDKLLKYGEFLNVSNQLACLDRPTHFNQLSLENFFHNEAPLVTHEQYIENRSDMVALKAGRDDAWLDRKIFQILVKLNSAPIQWLFSSQDTAIIVRPSSASFSIQKIRLLKTGILITLMLFFFSVPLIPLFIWSHTDDMSDSTVVAKMMGLQVSAALLFGVVLAACTRAKKHEILTACAGYVAILVVFMSGQN